MLRNHIITGSLILLLPYGHLQAMAGRPALPFYKKPWGMALVAGSGLALTATAAYLLLRPKSTPALPTPPPFEVTPEQIMAIYKTDKYIDAPDEWRHLPRLLNRQKARSSTSRWTTSQDDAGDPIENIIILLNAAPFDKEMFDSVLRQPDIDVSQPIKMEWTPQPASLLHLCASIVNHRCSLMEDTIADPAIKSLLAHSTADLNQQGPDGNTPLHLAASYLRYGAMLALLDDPRTNPNMQNRDGNTALHIAVKKCIASSNLHATAFLTRKDLDLTIKNKAGLTPVDLARALCTLQPRHTDKLSDLIMALEKYSSTDGSAD